VNSPSASPAPPHSSRSAAVSPDLVTPSGYGRRGGALPDSCSIQPAIT
jgi:hypothetical protein